MKKYFLFFIFYFLFAGGAFAFNTAAKSAYLIDQQSGAELFAKSADEMMPPSSMLKLMTLAVAFDAIKSGDLKMTDKLTVGENADYKNPNWRDASKICLVRGQTISVNDAIMGTIVLSGGDAALVLAEKLAGTESAFTVKMQARAREIGMPNSVFGNATGLPDPNNLMTSRELARLAQYLIETHPDLYPLFAARRFEFNDYKADWCRDWGKSHTVNYNKLLFIMPGADGLKTGHTADGGYGMVASAKLGGRRLIGVINGFKGKGHDALAAEMKKLLNHGFESTSNRVFYNPGDKILEIPVWYGRKKTAIATVAKTFAITLNRGESAAGLRVLARYTEPLPAPIAKGTPVGEIIAEINGHIVARAPLVAAERVRKTQLIGRIIWNLKVIFNGRS
ncbi:MAG: D-alanyl-D-alanine carboxypeptidase [Rickettsiales bacterium]|nr:D-alanyl-D-alanine carboxypeptidase [Rickettsiales bacterium]